MKTRIAILGYGNLGRGVEAAIAQNEDLELAAVFTRRDPASLKLHTPGVPAVSASELAAWKDRVDVLALCGGSATTPIRRFPSTSPRWTPPPEPPAPWV